MCFFGGGGVIIGCRELLLQIYIENSKFHQFIIVFHKFLISKMFRPGVAEFFFTI